ncbi:ATP-binding protein [Nocardiopsis synnemataformans]|uniref:ATP-binding protein n=1 Tax=Nocardiopsis synnemataformans TaxID=61305 RepID=UPI003EBBC7FC
MTTRPPGTDRAGRRNCGGLGLPHAEVAGHPGEVPDLAENAVREQMTYTGFLPECDDRARRCSERRIKAVSFLRDFDFEANHSIGPATVHTLASCKRVKKGQPLCLIGDSGTGKAHLLITLGTEVAMAGFRVQYTLATKLVNELVKAADSKQLSKTIARYGQVNLLCVDELGYMELDRRGASPPTSPSAGGPGHSPIRGSARRLWTGSPSAALSSKLARTPTGSLGHARPWSGPADTAVLGSGRDHSRPAVFPEPINISGGAGL